MSEPVQGRTRRYRRAALAQRLLSHAPDAAAALDWDTLGSAPDWLVWPEPQATRFQCQVGALLCAPQVRLWIDAPRVAAAARALGHPYLQALLRLPETLTLPHDVAGCPRITAAGQVAPLLRAAGVGVLLASLPAGPLRRAAGALLAPLGASAMVGALAQSLVARTLLLAEQAGACSVAAPIDAVAA